MEYQRSSRNPHVEDVLCRKKGLLLKCSQWVRIWFDWCVFAGQKSSCALRLRSSIQKTTTQLSEIGCVKSWWIEKKLGDARVDLVAAGDAAEIYTVYEIKSLPNPLKLMMFLFLKSDWRWGMPRFSRAQKKTRLCHPLAARICWDWRKQQLQKQFTSFQLNIPISWWIFSNSEIPWWTFPIEPFSPPRQTCFDFTRAPWAGGIKMFQMLRWNCSKLKVAQLPQQVV